MTPPALVLVSPAPHGSLLRSRRLRAALAAARPDLLLRHAAANEADVRAAVQSLLEEGASEVICVPLIAAARTSDAQLAAAIASAGTLSPDAPVSLAEPLGAPGACFTALDRQLAAALAASRARELDALVLWHDARTPGDDAALHRRARVWAAHHHLPYRLAALAHPHGIDDAVAAHANAGHRHVGVAILAVDVDPRERERAARLPGVIGVSRPLGDDPAILDAVLAQYAVAALRALEVAA